MKKIKIISFWEGFDNKNNFIINLLNKNNINNEYSDENPEILFVGSFVNKCDYDYIKDFKGIKILYISEPIDVMYILTFELFKSDIFNIVFGCISNNIEKKYFKYPLYIDYSYNYYLNDSYKDININILNDDIEKKNFCTLINTHDRYNTRTKIYNKLKNIDKIDCPSILFNNMNNNELNSIGNIKFINRYLFNLYPENTKCQFKGYITEKLMNCCLSGSIPIYFGSFDEIDEQIFNKERIIFYNPYENNFEYKIYEFVNQLYNDKNKLKIFYEQPVFSKNARNIIENMEINLINEIKTIFY